MAPIDTPLLIVGHGPAALVAAKVASGRGLPSLVAGHEVVHDAEPVVLDERATAILGPHGVLEVLRPYASAQDPFTIAPVLFEQGLKHHCVADLLVTVYDGMALEDARPVDDGVDGVLTGSGSRWEIHADAVLDVSELGPGLNEAIRAAAEAADTIVDGVAARGGEPQ